MDKQTVKQQLIDMIAKAEELFNEGGWTVDGLAAEDDELEDVREEIGCAIRAAMDTVYEYLD